MKFKDNFLLYTLVPLTILFIAATYVRFIVTYDYMVTYEADCNTDTHNCFIGCLDDNCTEEYYYQNITKKASYLNQQCGKDITNCDNANLCLANELDSCKITYCQPEIGDTNCVSLKSLNTP